MARRSDHTREEIKAMAIDAAGTIVEEYGFKGLSARKVAAEIGYTVGTLYLVFENLEELFLHINGRTLDQLYNAIVLAAEKCDQPKACIHAIGSAYIDFAIKNNKRWNMIFEHIHPDESHLPHWYQEKIARLFYPVEHQVALILGASNKDKAPILARALWCGLHGVCILAFTKKLGITGIDSVPILADSLINNFLSGLTISCHNMEN